MENLPAVLRETTEEIAQADSFTMDVWRRHSEAALLAAERLERLEAESARARGALLRIRERLAESGNVYWTKLGHVEVQRKMLVDFIDTALLGG
jgi:hypothetical protein